MIVDSVSLSRQALECLAALSREHDPLETGGVLVGVYGDGVAHVVEVTGPGPEAKQGPASFRRDGYYSQSKLNRILELYGGSIDYLGEWHSHPVMSPPSNRDIRSMKWISENPDYEIKFPLLIIMHGRGDREWFPDAYQWNSWRLERLKIVDE